MSYPLPNVELSGFIRTVLLSALFLFFSPQSYAASIVKVVKKADWVEVKSPHFVLVSDGKLERAEELVQELERFRQVVQRLTGVVARENDPPLKVLAAKDRRIFNAVFGTNKFRAGGFFTPRVRGHQAVIDLSKGGSRKSKKKSAFSVLFHEYVHYLVRNNNATRYPPWYNEGFADYLSTIQILPDGTVELGAPVRERGKYLIDNAWLPFDELVSYNSYPSKRKVGAFYAQGWLLTHYLASDDERRKQLSEYLRQYDQGAVSADDFEQLFQMSYSKLKQNVLGYYKRNRYPVRQIRFKEGIDSGDLASRTLSSREAVHSVAKFISTVGRNPKDAARLWRAAADKGSSNPDILTGYAEVLAKGGDPKSASKLLELVIQNFPKHALAYLVRGDIHMSVVRKQAKEGGEIDTKLLSAARSDWFRAIKLNPRNAEAYFKMGRSYLFSKDISNDTTLKSFERAYQLAPWHDQSTFFYALVSSRHGESARAVKLLEKLVVRSKSERGRQRAEKLLASIKKSAEN